jgi:hypothetical protein
MPRNRCGMHKNPTCSMCGERFQPLWGSEGNNPRCSKCRKLVNRGILPISLGGIELWYGLVTVPKIPGIHLLFRNAFARNNPAERNQ